ncbi:hypothetical protein B1A99_27250 [Cohnella sp. CIP 111063]|uniref:hypothetical protein n=1 Tax=unclassified Cohnella TaxID=2636738 RepID=UPI000B8C301B|nr:MULTISPECIES: hypothetical protein [unclassified Cohnella]OXS54286.1 hypothetical protein B1A99_27250 [Cohnella sp. CIP 111063]PRX63481.1 hypothetical protein B0G52_121105 [Cohnella sp. SGD-V74]
MNRDSRAFTSYPSGRFVSKAALYVGIMAILLLLSIYIGSVGFGYVDLALYGYLWATVLSILLFTARIAAWTSRPPARRLWRQGLSLFSSPRGWMFLIRTLFDNIGRQRFISGRSWQRWAQHMLLSWGVLVSFGITYALVLNWMHFELVEPRTYSVVVFGIHLFRMGVDSFLAILLYHGLNWTGIAVIIGCLMAMRRREINRKNLVEQTKDFDIFPLVLLIAISITGSLLTVSAMWMEGVFYTGIALSHQVAVIVFLLYMPFSKFWHIPLRFLGVVVPMYHAAHAPKACSRCGREYATETQIRDVQAVLQERGIPVRVGGTSLHMSDFCSECRRVSNRLAAAGSLVQLEKSRVVLQGNGSNGLTLADGFPAGMQAGGAESHGTARPER